MNGNPDPVFCNEPCGVITRRHIQIEFSNPYNTDMIVYNYRVDSMRHTLYANRNSYAEPQIVSQKFIQFSEIGDDPQDPNKVCPSPFPIPVYGYNGSTFSYGAYVPMATNDTCPRPSVNPFIIPANKTVFVMMEIGILFACGEATIPYGD
jgi:hypothetical protein